MSSPEGNWATLDPLNSSPNLVGGIGLHGQQNQKCPSEWLENKPL
jgi:hypothetical protein